MDTSLVDNVSNVLSHLRELRPSCEALLKDTLGLCLVSSGLDPCVPFPFADCALYLFAVKIKAVHTTICETENSSSK